VPPRVVLITGATGGLGRVATRVFAADGHRLVLGGTDEGRLLDLAAEVGLDHDAWTPLVVDLTDGTETRAALTAVEDALGAIDILIHLVGGSEGGAPVVDVDPDVVRKMLDRHLWTTLHVTQAVVPGMVRRGWGRIVAVSAPAASEPLARFSPYAVGKAAQEILLRTLARENANSGMTVNLVVVRAIDLTGERRSDPKRSAWTTPDEIAATFRFLVSDEAAAITGARIPLFGR
jgi:NAD(P)-dependent dehydrogenase (short-subunit alcohol dehydrogenase family)